MTYYQYLLDLYYNLDRANEGTLGAVEKLLEEEYRRLSYERTNDGRTL